MTGLQELIPHPRLTEVDTVELAIPLDQAWHVIRHASLGRLPLVRALFSLRTGKAPDLDFDHFVSTPQRPGFQLWVDRPLRELAVGAIGRVWKLDIPFLHVPDAAAFTAFASAGWVKVAWALQLHE
ncbi:MAG: Polyketide cyclase/dehydrase, partial [Myxococcaceae bacterium]|nr:Polyketide cyclase/dehydrase [Myxococcaceae bacterium]